VQNQDFWISASVRLAKTFVGKITVTGRADGAQQVVGHRIWPSSANNGIPIDSVAGKLAYLASLDDQITMNEDT
jgi:hypothetical protein